MNDGLHCDKCNKRLAEASGVIVEIQCPRCSSKTRFKFFEDIQRWDIVGKIKNILSVEN